MTVALQDNVGALSEIGRHRGTGLFSFLFFKKRELNTPYVKFEAPRSYFGRVMREILMEDHI